MAERDERIRTAYASGLTKTEIHRLTGVSRTHIDSVLGKEPANDNH